MSAGEIWFPIKLCGLMLIISMFLLSVFTQDYAVKIHYKFFEKYSFSLVYLIFVLDL